MFTRSTPTLKNKALSRQGSALIMVILLVVLLVTMAVTFLSMVGRQRGSSVISAAQTRADIALQTAQNHVIKTMVESAADTSIEYHNVFNPTWRTEFTAVTNPDGDPFTEDGVGKPAGTQSTSSKSSYKVSSNKLVNSKRNLFDMVGMSTGRYYSNMFTFGLDIDRWSGSSVAYCSRWYNVAYLDDEFNHIKIDESMPSATKSDLRREARYVVRYMAQVMDLNGMQCINNNYPNGPIPPGTASVSDAEYVRYQSYLRTFGRSIKSQISCYMRTHGFGMQRRSNDPDLISVDPLDREVCNIFVNGNYVPTPYGDLGFSLANDARLRAERAFRGEMQWADQLSVGGAGGGRVDKFGSIHKSRVYSWGQINQIFIGEDVRYHMDNSQDVCSFAPYGESLDYFNNQYAAPAPWRVNLLTASNNVLAKMIMGLSSELQYTRHDNPLSGNGDRGARADLFGRHYPEAFPLAIDEGRDVPLVGEGTVDSKGDRVVTDNGKSEEGFPAFGDNGGPIMTSGIAGQSGIQASPGYENSYIMDIAMACNLAMRNVRRAWVEDRDLPVGSEKAYPTTDPIVFKYKNGVNNSYIDRSVDEPKEMIKLVIREIYRILGEGYINTSNAPATSHNLYDINEPGLLAGGVNNVGLGSHSVYERRAQLSSTANTRAMEYVLNDFMISLFGKANPDYNTGDPRNPGDNTDPISENIAVDFNGDGVAESTVTGWIDASTNFTSKRRIWSFWFDGLGPYVQVKYAYMKEPGWYRFLSDGTILRKNGAEWLTLSFDEASIFRDYNSIWLTGNNSYPLKAVSRTGRFFIGKSKILQGFMRAEVYNLLKESVVSSSNRSFVYTVDPNNDGDYSDSHIIRQSDFTIK